MKRIIKLSLIMAMILLCISTVVNAETKLGCRMSITGQAEASIGDEVTFEVKISNITSDRGIIGISATLDYDKDGLELVEMKGQNGWESPTGNSYNESTGKMAITKNDVTKSDETVFTAKFKVKDTSKKNLKVSLMNIEVADGSESAEVIGVAKTITVKAKEENKKDEDGTIIISQTTTKNNNSNKGNNNKVTLPQTGANNTAIIICAGICILVAIGFLVKILLMNKQLKKWFNKI